MAVAVPESRGQAAAQPAQPTPPPPPETEEPPPTPETPAPETPAPETDTPETGTPETETPESQTPETPSSEPETQTSKPLQNLSPEEQKKKEEATDRIDELNASKKVKGKLKQVVEKVASAIDDPKTSPDDKKIYEKMLDDINKTLVLIQDTKTPPRERRALTNSLQAVDEVLKGARNQKASSEDRDIYKQLAVDLIRTGLQLRDETISANQRRSNLIALEIVSAGLLAAQNPEVKPKEPEDQKKINKEVKENAQAVVTSQDPQASKEERDEAKQEVDQLVNSVKDPKYLEFVKQVKQYDASTSCISTIEDRTREAGWPDGSLWGLSDPACDEPRATGVEDTSSKWNKLFVCVDENPFSTCQAYIPKD